MSHANMSKLRKEEDVAVDAILACAAVLTRAALALIDVNLAVVATVAIRTVAGVAVDTMLACATVLTRAALTLSDTVRRSIRARRRACTTWTRNAVSPITTVVLPSRTLTAAA